MAKILKSALALLLAVLMICGSVGVTVFAEESKKFPINKVNNGLNIDDFTDVTLTVPGMTDSLGMDIVYITGGVISKEAADSDDMLQNLKEAIAASIAQGTPVNFGIATYSYGLGIALPLTTFATAEDLENFTQIVADAFAEYGKLEDGYDGSGNMEQALTNAKKLLSSPNSLKDYPERQHIVLYSSGQPYEYNGGENNEYVSCAPAYVYGPGRNPSMYWSGSQWSNIRVSGSSQYYIPTAIVDTYKEHKDQYTSDWDCYWSYITKWVEADRKEEKEENPAMLHSYNYYEFAIGGTVDYTFSSLSADDMKKYPNIEINKQGKASIQKNNLDNEHAIIYERAMYEAYEYAKANIIDAGINLHPIYAPIKGKAEYINGAYNRNYVGHCFMDMLAGGKAAIYQSSDDFYFASVREKILYTCSTDSYVEDFIGKNENGNFEFIQDVATIKLTVGGVEYETRLADSLRKSETWEVATFCVDFYAPGASEPTFWLDYYYGDGETTERFIWTFGEDVSLLKPASLTYKLQLKDKQEEEGTYTVPTNNSATLHPVDSDGKEGEPQVFPVPEVEYVVYGGTDVELKKVDENGKPLSGVTFELFVINGEEKTSLGQYTVNEKGTLTFKNLKVGIYEIVETVTPEGYIGVKDPMRFEVFKTENGFGIKEVFGDYELRFPATAYEISNHSFYPAIPQTFVLLNADNAADWEYTGEYVFGKSDYQVVYCADSTTGATNGTSYNKVALEDHYSPEVAGKLRAIIANSYPYVSIDEMVQMAIDAGVADAANLTRGDIIAAVQLAIWNYTNGGGYTYRATYSVMNYPQWGKVFHDYTDELPDYLPKNTTKRITDTAGAARVDALYAYLVGLAPMTETESEIDAFVYVAKDGKDASQTLIGADRTGYYTNGIEITVKNYSKAQYDVDIVIALGAGIAQYDRDNAKYTHTYDSIVNLVKPLIDEGVNVKLGFVAVEHYDDVAMDLTLLPKNGYEDIIQNALDTIQDMPAGPTNLHGNIEAAKKMLEEDTSVANENKFFYVIATGRTYNFDVEGVPSTIISKVTLKGQTYYYWGHYLWQSQRGGHTSLYMIPDRYNNDFEAYWTDVEKWVQADGNQYVYSFTKAYDASNPDWFNIFFADNKSDAKALGLASGRFGWILKDLTGKSLEAIGSGSNPQNALNYERAQYEAYYAYKAMVDAGYNCYALCSESTSYQNGSPYIQVAKYTGTSTIQLGHSFMNHMAKLSGQKEAPLLFVLTNPNTGASEMAKNFFKEIDINSLVKTEKAPAEDTTDEIIEEETMDKGPIMMSPAPVRPAIVITQQPVDVEAALGETGAVTVKADGEGLKYQWYYRDANKTEFSKSSITGTRYAVKMTKANDGREVYCVITDANGNTVTTDIATLTRTATPLEIITQPESVENALGETSSVKVVAQGEGLKYQWYYRDAGKTEFSKSSIKTATYSVKVTKANSGREVYCVITDAAGNTVTTETVKLNRTAIALSIVSQPTDVVVALGESASVKVVAEGEGLTYQWYYRDVNKSTFSKSSMKGATYAVKMNKSNNGREVYCVITDAAGNTVTTEIATLIKAD